MSGYKYTYFVIATIGIAVIVEIKAIYIFGQWSYNSLMPTVFGLGLSPLLQLAVTGMMASWLTRYFLNK